mmetsp:Transcript_3734/g.5786  ORF Transcript_3734/g.5786 Transcript_3734/m.5786 type:complete len:125 (+) Transcript_3734:85-459(+)
MKRRDRVREINMRNTIAQHHSSNQPQHTAITEEFTPPDDSESLLGYPVSMSDMNRHNPTQKMMRKARVRQLMADTVLQSDTSGHVSTTPFQHFMQRSFTKVLFPILSLLSFICVVVWIIDVVFP